MRKALLPVTAAVCLFNRCFILNMQLWYSSSMETLRARYAAKNMDNILDEAFQQPVPLCTSLKKNAIWRAIPTWNRSCAPTPFANADNYSTGEGLVYLFAG